MTNDAWDEGVNIMLLRDAQEESPVVYTAGRDSSTDGGDLLLSHISEAIDILESLKGAKRSAWSQVSVSMERMVGLLLLVALGIASSCCGKPIIAKMVRTE